ncbi:unnamed protein product, partial [Medioppia subpectinata]
YTQNEFNSDDFSPAVTARCERGVMYINVVTLQPFYGVVHTHGYRKGPCLIDGNGGFNTTLKVSLLADENDEIYCGINKGVKGERSVSLAIRPHKNLELTDDKNYYLTCEQSGGGTYKVILKLLDMSGQRAGRILHGNTYILRAQLTPYDSITSLRIKNCFAFTDDTGAGDQVQLIDAYGCPAPAADALISPFNYNTTHTAEAVLYEMFKYPDTNKLNIQCDAILCRG